MARPTPSCTAAPQTPVTDALLRAGETTRSARWAKTRLVRVLAVVAAAGIAVTAASFPITSAAAAGSTYGPDGTHYPSDTPDIRTASSDHVVVDVAASGPAIREALDALTSREIAEGVVIRVAPGRIDDLSALNGYSNTGGEKVLITARDGFQSVTGGSWALRDVTGITLMRFDIDALDVKGATHSSFAWLRINENWLGLSASAGVPVRDVELIEVVEPDSTVKNSDSAQIKAYSPDVMKDVLVEGGYIAPSYYVDEPYGGDDAPRPHTDSLQIEGGGVTGQVTVRDTVVFGSNNTAVIVGGVRNVAFEDSYIVGGSVTSQRYPFLPGGAGFEGAINGPGSLSAVQGSGGGNVDASDSTFIGSLQPTWDSVVNTRTNLPGKTAAKGGFTLDETLSSTTAADLDEVSTRPTAKYLSSIWDGVELPEPSATPTPTATASATPTPTATATASPRPTPTATPTPPRPRPDAPAEPEAPVADTTAPAVAITSPESGALISGTTTATVTATDDTEVTAVTFYVGSLKVGDAVQTDETTWSWRTRTAGIQGTYPLTARATDAAGNVSASDPVIVTLNQRPGSPKQ